jgi:UDP-N-acetylmuramate--alanine ligase
MENNIKRVFFLGIGGIGMSALARYFKALDLPIFGYDKTASDLCSSIEDEGMTIIYQDDLNLIPKEYFDKDSTLYIYTPAIPDTLSIKAYFVSNNYPLKKRAEILGDISRTKTCLAVAGTHGKTSTSSILGHIMYSSSKGCTAFIGGILKQYQSNLLLNPESEFMVVEADEFDRSFLHLDVDYSALTSIDADHLDIYGNENSIQETFSEYINGVNKVRIVQSDINLKAEYSYGLQASDDYYATDISWDGKKMSFILHLKDSEPKVCYLPFPGIHNVENAVAASALAFEAGVSVQEIVNALATFEGVYRRFDIEQYDDIVQIDDYAHHPTEIDRAIDSAKSFFPDKKIVVIFQPHLFSRTRDFMSEFAESLSKADELAIMDIYPARELPIEGITSQVLVNQIPNAQLVARKDISEFVTAYKNSVILTLGAGDIANEVKPLRAFLNKKLNER